MPPDTNSFASIAAALSGAGFAIWYGWYNTSVVIPRLMNDFREERALDRAQRDKDRAQEEISSARHQAAYDRLSEIIGVLPCRTGRVVIQKDAG